jgi:hypothetical protein
MSDMQGGCGGTEDPLVDQQFAIGCHSQPKTWTQDDGDSPKKFASTIEHVTLYAFPAPHENHVCRGSDKAFGSGTRDKCIKQQLCLGGKRTVNEALRPTFGLEVIKLTFRSSIRVQKTSDRTLCSSRPPPERKKKWQYTYSQLETSSGEQCDITAERLE